MSIREIKNSYPVVTYESFSNKNIEISMFWICLKICCPQGRTGSSPVGGTLSKLNLVNKKPAVCGPFCFASISFAG